MHCLYLLVVRPLFSRFANRLATGVLRKHRLQLSRISGPYPGSRKALEFVPEVN